MKNSFILYKDQAELFLQLTDNEAGKIIKSIFMKINGKEKSEEDIKTFLQDRMLFIILSTLLQQIDRDAEKYAKKCKKLRENASKGGKARAENSKQMLANVSLNDTDTVNDTVNDNDNVKYKRPSGDEVGEFAVEYAQSNNFNVNEVERICHDAWEYYTDLSGVDNPVWVDSKGTVIKNWKLKLKRVWLKDVKPVEQIKVNPLNVC